MTRGATLRGQVGKVTRGSEGRDAVAPLPKLIQGTLGEAEEISKVNGLGVWG